MTVLCHAAQEAKQKQTMHQMAAMSAQEYYVDYKPNHIEGALVIINEYGSCTRSAARERMRGVIALETLNPCATKYAWTTGAGRRVPGWGLCSDKLLD